MTYGPDDCFDGRGLVAEKVSSRFVASEEIVAYQLTKQAVSELIASNATFELLLFSDLANKLSAISERQSQHQMQSLTLARMDEAFVRPAHFVDADTDILSVVRVFQSLRTNSVLVRDNRTQPPGQPDTATWFRYLHVNCFAAGRFTRHTPERTAGSRAGPV